MLKHLQNVNVEYLKDPKHRESWKNTLLVHGRSNVAWNAGNPVDQLTGSQISEQLGHGGSQPILDVPKMQEDIINCSHI